MVISRWLSHRRSGSGHVREAAILVVGLLAANSQWAYCDNSDKSHGADSLGHFLDVTNPYVSAQYTNDSNVLRLDDIQPVENRAD